MLPEEQRTAIVLKEYCHGLTFQEIADLLDCPLSTVKTRLYQGSACYENNWPTQGSRAYSAAARSHDVDGSRCTVPVD